MGTGWSESRNENDEQEELGKKEFYSILKQVVVVIENAASAEDDLSVDHDEMLQQVQLVLENWSREVDLLYERVGDYPLVLPIHEELRATDEETPNTGDTRSDPLLPITKEEQELRSLCSDKSSDSKTIYEAISQLAVELSSDDLLRVIATYPRASRLFVSQCLEAHADVHTPFRMFKANKQYIRAAMVVGLLAYGEESFVKKRQRLQEMANLLSVANEEVPSSTSIHQQNSFDHTMTVDMIRLLDAQNKLENFLEVMHLSGSSLIETLHKLLFMFPVHPNALSAAVAFSEQFSVHPRQFWWAIVRIFSEKSQWKSLLMLAAAIPPVIGFVSIAEIMIEYGQIDLTSELLSIINSPLERNQVVEFLAQTIPSDENI